MSRSASSYLISLAATLLALLFVAPASGAQPVTIALAEVGNAGNAADSAVMVTDTTTGYGGVNYAYSIGAYDVTLTQYTAFLNAVAKTDPYGLYNASLGTADHIKGISQSGTSGAYAYSVIGNGSNPVTYVSWLDAARFCNWLQNGQPTTGVENTATTEEGAYTLDGDISNGLETKNLGATWWIPAEDEWYKAAYYDPTLNGGNGGYWSYPTHSNAAPGNVVGSGTNEANYNNGVYCVTQGIVESSAQNYLSAVGSFPNSATYYDTFDQGGDVYQWNDAVKGASRGVRGGQWANPAADLQSVDRETRSSTNGNNGVGFRVASVAAVSASPPVISSNLSATAINGLAFSYQVTASNDPISFAESGALPAGLGFTSSTGVISGTPSQSGTFSPSISAINSSGTGSATLTLIVITLQPPIISSTLSATATNGQPFTYQITASNAVTGYSASGLPPGLLSSTSTGLISGTPTQSGTFSATIDAINIGGTGSATLSIVVVTPPAPVIDSPLAVTGTIGFPFAYQITASNYPTHYVATGLPLGVGYDGASGLVSGSPSMTGTFVGSISAINLGGTDTETFTVVIVPPPPIINSSLTATALEGSAFSYQITATNDPVSFNATGFPAGMMVSSTSGLISGAPSVTGTFPVDISATNANGTSSAILVLTVGINYKAIAGTYEGLGAVGGANAGHFTLTLTSKGAFTGKLVLPGVQYPIKGAFTSLGTFNATPPGLSIALNVEPMTRELTGTIAATSGTPITYTVESGLIGKFNAQTLPVGLAGKYTALIPSLSGTDPTLPNGAGYGTMTVSTAGAVSLAGKLGDGSAFKVAGHLRSDGETWTLFQLLYPGKHPGVIASTITFENLPGSDCDGVVDWLKPPQASGAYYPAGFSAKPAFMAAKYVPPAFVSGAGTLTSGTLALVGGDLSAASIADSMTISSKDKIVVTGTNDATITVTPGTGAFSGSFHFPGTNKKTTLSGVLYQKPAPPAGFGLFIGTDQTGLLEILLQPSAG